MRNLSRKTSLSLLGALFAVIFDRLNVHSFVGFIDKTEIFIFQFHKIGFVFNFEIATIKNFGMALLALANFHICDVIKIKAQKI